MLQSFVTTVAQVWEAFWRALVLDPALLEVAQGAPAGSGVPVVATIVVLAGAAQLLGQSVVLFVNRVQPARFAVSLLLNGVLYGAGLLLWATAIWLVGRAFGYEPGYALVLRMVGLGSAPLIFSIFVLIPYAGPLIGRILSVWTFLVTLGMLRFTFQADLVTALVIVGAGWAGVVLLNGLAGRPIRGLRRRLFRRVANAELDATAHDLLKSIPGAGAAALPRPDGRP